MSDIRVYVESPADARLAAVLLPSSGVLIKPTFASSDAIMGARGALGLQPRPPAVVLLGTRTTSPEEIYQMRAAINRLVNPDWDAHFCIALAVQRLLDWALTDPKLRQAFEASPQDMKIYADRADRAAELAKKVGFDNATLLQQNADYRGLLDFIRQHAGASRAAS